MRYGLTMFCAVAAAVWWGGYPAVLSNSPVQAQSAAPERRPRLKGFDPSLRKKTDREDKGGSRSPQGGGEAGAEDVVRIETTLVVADVLILDKQGRSIAGLKREDFVVREDDAPQSVGSFSRGDGGTAPRSIVLIIDYSGSQRPYINASVEAAKTLVDKLAPADRMAIVTDDVELLVDFTRDKTLLKEKLDFLKRSALSGKGGRSAHYTALLATLNELFDAEDLRPIVIFQADGDELAGLRGSGPRNRYMQERSFGFEDILIAAEKSRATVYAVIPGVRLIGLSEDEQRKKAKLDMENRAKAAGEQFGATTPRPDQMKWTETFYKLWAGSLLRRQMAMAGLAKYTGGWADYLEQPEQAGEVYARIFAGINSRYIIGYYPTNHARDGKRRKVSIEVRGHPEYTVWGRKTYFAPEPDK